MAQTIKLKRSGTSGAVPTTSQLELGEVAINTYDGKMYIKKDDGTESIIEVGSSALPDSFKLYEYSVSSSQTTFSGSDDNSNTLAYKTGSPPYVQVFLNGVLLDWSTDYTATNGTSVVLSTAAISGDLLQIAAYTSTIVSSTFAYTRTTATATASQTTFSATYTAGYVDVYLNGVKLVSGTDFTATNGTSVVLTTGATAGDNVEILAYETFAVANALTVGNNLSDVSSAATAISNLGITSTAAEINLLDGVTATTAELNYLDITTLGTSEASKVVTADANGVVTFDNGISEEYTAVTSTSNATTVNLQDGTNFSHTLTENTTFTFSNPASSGKASSFTLKIVQDASASGFTITWPAAVDWPSATAPTLTATASAVDYFVFITHDGGTTWYGFTGGQAFG